MNQVKRNHFFHGDVLKGLQQLPDKSVHTCITSPPYFGLRDYGIEPSSWPQVQISIFGFDVTIQEQTCCLGMEKTPMEFIGHMVLVFREVYRVLRDDGTLWLNIGDSYAANAKSRTPDQVIKNSRLGGGKATQISCSNQINKVTKGLKYKDMIGIPWMLAFALRDDGWYLRSDVIWSKPNPMPESVTDRPTKAHEYIFLLSKKRKYYYDHYAIKTQPKESSFLRWDQDIDSQNGSDRGYGGNRHNGNMKPSVQYKKLPPGQNNIRKVRDKQRGHSRKHAGFNDRWDQMTKEQQMSIGANKRTVWEIPTMPFKEAHFATFPQDIPSTCIKAATSQKCCAECGSPYVRQVKDTLVPTKKAGKNFVIDDRDFNADKNDAGSNRQKDGHKSSFIYQTETIGWNKSCECKTNEVANAIVLETFSGAGTTPLVARKLNRDFYAIDIKKEYINLARKRLREELGLFEA